MRILFITDNFIPEVNAPATRTYEHAKEWVKLGEDVSVITTVPNFPNGKILNGYENKIYQKEYIDGIEVIRVWSYMTANIGLFKRTADYISFSISSFIAGLFQNADIIIATSPQFFTTWSAYLLNKVKRIPWIFELRDIWPESIKALNVLDYKKTLNILERVELGLYRDSNSVIAVTDAFKENLINRGIDRNKISVVTNGANIELFYLREKNREILERLNLKDKFIVGYIGTHGIAHRLDFIVKSISKIDDENIHFLFIGDGAMKQIVVNLVKELKLKNITLLDSVPKDEVPKYLSVIDVSLVPLKKSDTFKDVIPSKIFEASAMRKPILLGVEGQAKKVIEKYGAGVYFEPENEKDFIEKLYLLKNDKDLYNRCRRGSIELTLNFDRKKLAYKMLNIIKNITINKNIS